MIRVTPSIAIDEDELHFDFVRSSGPGGQNVNKVATAVQLRFDARHSNSLPEDVRERLRRVAGRRMTTEGVIVITAQRYRSQQKNREDAVERLISLIQRASAAPKKRKKTRPSRESRERRLREKKKRAQVKRKRGRVRADEE